MLTNSERKFRDKLLERNYDNAKQARDTSEVDKHNADFNSLMAFAMSKVPANKRKEAESMLSGGSKMSYTEPTEAIKSLASTAPEKDVINIAREGNLKFKIIRDTNEARRLK